MSEDIATPIIYRASELGGCVKALAAKRLGYEYMPPPSSLLSVFAEGNLHEEAVIALLNKGRTEVTRQQEEVTMNVTSSIAVVGHIDGVVGDHPLEIKSMSVDAYKEFNRLLWDTPGLIQKYKWQVSVYMHGTGLPLLLMAKNRNSGAIHSLSRAEPFYSEAEIRTRVLSIEAQVRQGNLPPCDNPIFPCPVFYLHESETVEVIEDAEIDSLAHLYKKAIVDEKVATEKKKAAYNNLMQVAKTRDGKVVTPTTTVTVYEASNPPKLDLKGLVAEVGEEVVAKYQTRTKSFRMKVVVEDE